MPYSYPNNVYYPQNGGYGTMGKPLLYLDVCTLCRPFDDQNMMRIRLETDSYHLILQENLKWLNMPHQKRMDSVKRHHEWQGRLVKEQFFSEIFDAWYPLSLGRGLGWGGIPTETKLWAKAQIPPPWSSMTNRISGSCWTLLSPAWESKHSRRELSTAVRLETTGQNRHSHDSR